MTKKEGRTKRAGQGGGRRRADARQGRQRGHAPFVPRAFARNSDDCYRHWAGRNSRGVTQYDGKALEAIVEDFDSGIDYIAAQDFISECFCT